MSVTDREKQVAEAEELLGDRLGRVSFAQGLYFGRFLHKTLVPYPDLRANTEVNEKVAALERFCTVSINPAAIDRNADIPREVIDGLGELGVLGACLPKSAGGLGYSQKAYCRLLEVLGGHCASTALFVNAHHSIGPRAIVLFGTAEQQEHWLPKLASGEWISAFALTEEQAGSDAGNVQTAATPTADGSGYVLNGDKRYITNGSIAQVLTVMARTPIEGSHETKVTAFLVTPEMPGFEVTEARMPKCGVRGTVTSRLAFREMFVPRENVLGRVGGGLRVALTVLDYGRTTFGATCTGAGKFCLRKAVEHANTRRQFGQALGEFEMVQEKLARMAASIYAMEAATYQTAAQIDGGADEYMLETAMLKIFATDELWRIINDTIQIFGGQAYFSNEPYERMMRDARINLIGEGANDVLRAFVALVGMREVGLELKGVVDALKSPIGNFTKLGSFASRRLGAMLSSPPVELKSSELEGDAARHSRLLGTFYGNIERLLGRYQEAIVDRQHQLGRIADAAIEIYVSSCVLSRLDRLMWASHASDQQKRHDLQLGRYYLQAAERRIRHSLAALWDNDDEETGRIAKMLLSK